MIDYPELFSPAIGSASVRKVHAASSKACKDFRSPAEEAS